MNETKSLLPHVIYTLKDSAAIAGCSPATVRNDIDNGRCDGVRLSDGSRVVPGVALAQYARVRRAARKT